jgi:hypothetical protein
MTARPQVVFEEFGFASYYVQPAPVFSLHSMAAANPALPASQVRCVMMMMMMMMMMMTVAGS